MKTAELLKTLPKEVVAGIEKRREEYTFAKQTTDTYLVGAKRLASMTYCEALRDAGLITEAEKRVLFTYTTVDKLVRALK